MSIYDHPQFDLSDPVDVKMATVYPAVMPPCPAWCVLPAGHRYEGLVDEWQPKPTLERTHSTRDWDAHRETRNGAELVQLETTDGTALTLHPPVINVMVGGNLVGDLTTGRPDAETGWAAGEAIALALDLYEAVDVLRGLGVQL